MRPGLQVGHSHEFSVQVTEAMQARLEGGPVHDLYGTASMIAHMEWAARQHILPYLEAGEEGVGYHVDVKHLSPTALGETVRIRSTVTEVGEQRITSHVEAWNAHGKIGDGYLVQAIVSQKAFYARASEASGKPDDAPPPEPAVLVSMDGRERFTLDVLRWEAGSLPCTRYDEWLICRAVLSRDGENFPVEGAFLLRYEIEEWLNGAKALANEEKSEFRSDFLEPVLKVEMMAPGAGQIQLSLTLTPPEQPGRTLIFSVPDAALPGFIRRLEAQVEGFPSRL